jgi:hypothetical protein
VVIVHGSVTAWAVLSRWALERLEEIRAVASVSEEHVVRAENLNIPLAGSSPPTNDERAKRHAHRRPRNNEQEGIACLHQHTAERRSLRVREL